MIFKPFKYQEFAKDHIINNHNAGLFLDMGMGKTVTTLTAINDLMYDYFEISKVLVIAPLRVAEDTWSREIEKWEHLKDLKVSKILGTEKKRIGALNAKADIYVINRDNVVWLVKKCFNKWDFDTVVVDELSSFKSSKAKRFRALKKVRPRIKRFIGLTGTPAPNTYIDLWPQMYLLDRGQRLGKTLTPYKDMYFNPGRRNGRIVYEWKLKNGAQEIIQEKIKDICISMSANDYLDLPEKIDNIIKVKIPRKKDYKELEKELIINVKDKDIVASTAAVLANKLLQFSNGAIYDEDKNVIEIHEEKLKVLEDIIESSNGKPVLVFYNFKHDKDRILEHFKSYKPVVLGNSKDIKRWNEGKITLMLTHPASAGHGLNLQDGGSTIVWFGLTWSLELYQQANARLYRQGQKETVIVHHIVGEDTIDEEVLKAIENKAEGQNALIEAVKARIEQWEGLE